MRGPPILTYQVKKKYQFACQKILTRKNGQTRTGLEKNGPIIQPKFRFTDTDKHNKSSTTNLFEFMALDF